MSDEDEFEPYEDMFEENQVPMYGLRFIVATDPDGQVFTEWAVEGDPAPDTLIGTLERVKFFIQIHNLNPTGLLESEYEDEEEPDGAE